MKITLTENRFIYEMLARDDNSFSCEALAMIYEYYEEIDPDLEFDPVSTMRAFSEMTLREIADDYSYTLGDSIALEGLRDKTTVLGETSDGKIVFVQF